jgi:hypothetical protein
MWNNGFAVKVRFPRRHAAMAGALNGTTIAHDSDTLTACRSHHRAGELE